MRICSFFVFFMIITGLNAAEIGVVRATRKITFDDSVPKEKEIFIEVAKNEWEGFQIVLKDEKSLKNVDVLVSDLKSSNGNVIESKFIRAYREYFLNIVNPSEGSLTLHERTAGFYPDPLIPLRDPYNDGNVPAGAPFDIPKGETGVIFVDIYVPNYTAPDIYKGRADIFSDGDKIGEVLINAEVWEFEIPEERGIATAYHMGANQIKRYHGGIDATDESVGEIIKRYYLALHEHRIDPIHIVGSVEFKFDEDGELLPVDWTEFDNKLSGWMDGSYLGTGYGVKRFNLGYFSPGFGTGSMTEQEYVRASKAFAEHIKDKGWWDRGYIYAIDEPWLNGGQAAWNQIKKDASLLFEGTDLWKDKILVTGPYNPDLKNEVGIWCPVTPMYEDWFYLDGSKAGREEYQELFKEGKELWFYVCNANFPPYAGYDIDTRTGFEPRIVKWGAWYEGATGFLYWSTTYWIKNDPWNNYLDTETFGEMFARNGDGFLLYPGDHNGTLGGIGSPADISIDGPVLSYRLKQIRDGFEDWEMFILADRVGAGSYARRQVNRAYKRFGDFMVEDCRSPGDYCPKKQPWTLDDELLYEVRRNIAKKILYMMYPGKYPDPEAPIDQNDGGTDTVYADVILADTGSSSEDSHNGCSCSHLF